MNCEICGKELTEEEEIEGVCNDCTATLEHDYFEENQLFEEDF